MPTTILDPSTLGGGGNTNPWEGDLDVNGNVDVNGTMTYEYTTVGVLQDAINKGLASGVIYIGSSGTKVNTNQLTTTTLENTQRLETVYDFGPLPSIDGNYTPFATIDSNGTNTFGWVEVL